MFVPECPTGEMLGAYAAGKLANDTLEAVAVHIETCSACQAALAALDDADDTFVQRLRIPVTGVPYVEEPQCLAAVARATAPIGKPLLASPPTGDPPKPPLHTRRRERTGKRPAAEQAARGEFDPYYQWLGIAPNEQPPNHYRLLGIKPFEDDKLVIDRAADQRMAHLRTFQAGKRAGFCSKLLNEVATARRCLLTPAKKNAYDKKLRQTLEAESPLPGVSLSTAADQSLRVPRQLGEYQLIEKLGEGGMGTVFKARHTKLKRVVALKVLARGRTQDERAVARFEREMAAVGQLSHPNIVQAHDARELGGLRFLVMEFVEGQDLSQLVQRLGPLPVADACEVIRQAALGLQYAHQRKLVHRDIKPSNLMLTAEGRVKILDLGLALLNPGTPNGEEMTGTGQIMGTAEYIAPEQTSDSHTVDIRADIYSLGCTLYKLLCGQSPFSGPQYKSNFEKMTAHVRDPVPPIRRHRADVPELLAEVLGRMLAKDPEQRYSTPAEVADAVGRFAADADLPALSAKAAGKPVPPPRTSHARTSTHDQVSLPKIDTDVARRAAPLPALARLARRRWMPWQIAVGIAAAAAVVLIAMAIIIRLTNDKIEVVITCPTAGVEIVIRRDGKIIEQITLEEGKNRVRIRSGEYEIALAGGETHGLEISDTKLLVARGEAPVLIVRRVPPEAEPGILTARERPAGWQPLFDGKTLRGWHTRGVGQWTVENGAIVGRKSIAEAGGGYLVSDAEFGDFVLRMKFKLREGDSGVYFRCRAGGWQGITGLQANLRLPNIAIGSLIQVFPEEHSGVPVLVPNPPNPVGSYFRPNDWNDLSITAEGGRVVVEVNGVTTAEMAQIAGLPRGRFALQLWGPRPVEVMFKDIVVRRMTDGPSQQQSLFDGKTLGGWHARGVGQWNVENGAIVGRLNTTQSADGHLVSDAEFGDFALRMKFKLLGGNSGVHFRSWEGGWSGVSGLQADLVFSGCIGSIYQVFPEEQKYGRALVPSPPDPAGRYFKANDWNDLTVTAEGGHVVVKVNGVTTAELFDAPGPLKGRFSFQLHGDRPVEVMFKDIVVRRIPAEIDVGRGVL